MGNAKKPSRRPQSLRGGPPTRIRVRGQHDAAVIAAVFTALVATCRCSALSGRST